MSIQLLDKTRKINKLLYNNASNKIIFNDICKVLSDVLESNVLVISKKGKILGIGKNDKVPFVDEFIKSRLGEYIDKQLHERLLSILSTKENVDLAMLGFNNDKKYNAIVTPVDISGERIATIFIYKLKELYDIHDIILSEYGTTVIGLDLMRSLKEEDAFKDRQRSCVKSAISTLSTSELEAVRHILGEMESEDAVIVASKVADKFNITRSVIVNALRKLESAGVIESKSSGMRGTYIKVINRYLYDEISV